MAYKETAMEYLRRLVRAMGDERESLLDTLPSPQAVLDYFELWNIYGVDGFDGIAEQIHLGEDPEPLRKFIKKYKLPWKLRRTED
jgi:hypothetical protein